MIVMIALFIPVSGFCRTDLRFAPRKSCRLRKGLLKPGRFCKCYNKTIGAVWSRIFPFFVGHLVRIIRQKMSISILLGIKIFRVQHVGKSRIILWLPAMGVGY